MSQPVLLLCPATVLSHSQPQLQPGCCVLQLLQPCLCCCWSPVKHLCHWQCLMDTSLSTGTVAVWNLLTKSLLQCVQQPDASLKLYPFQCFLAHDHAVRSIEWCKADSNFLVTVGSDRKIKFWDLRRLYEPINSIKRFLSTEVAWLLPYNGITVAQDNCYASYGLCGIHYIDAGYLGFKAYFVAPRKGTVWVRASAGPFCPRGQVSTSWGPGLRVG